MITPALFIVSKSDTWLKFFVSFSLIFNAFLLLLSIECYKICHAYCFLLSSHDCRKEMAMPKLKIQNLLLHILL